MKKKSIEQYESDKIITDERKKYEQYEYYKELLSLICEIIIESDGVIAESEIAEVKRLKAMCE